MAGNPKRVVRAFLPDSIRVGSVTLLPFTAGTVLLLEKLEHPLVDDQAKRDMTNEEVMSLLFVLTRPVKESNAVLNQGPEAFEEAVMEFASTIALRDLRSVGEAVRKSFAEAVSTALPSGPDEKKAPAG
jgi:hypothetical protein